MDSSSFQAVCDLLKDKHDKPGAIKRACQVVEECLITHRDNLRGFFEHCFPLLLKRIFGYDDREASWLHIVSVEARDEDSSALIQLLAPTGPLFAALHAADADRIIQFLFPPERLPAHTQELLRLPAGRMELDSWPQYRGRLRLDGAGRCQVHLNMFEYFMFWAAFYVLRGSRSSDKGKGSGGASRGRGLLPPGARKLWGSGGEGSGESMSHPRHPYYKLLRLYLEHYLPRPGGLRMLAGLGLGPGASSAAGGASSAGGGGGLGARGSGALAGLNTGGGAFAGGSLLQPLPGDVLLSVLLEFWLTDAGEPLPAEQPQAGGAASRASSPGGQLGVAPALAGPLVAQGSAMAAAAAAAAGGWGAPSAGGAGLAAGGGGGGPLSPTGGGGGLWGLASLSGAGDLAGLSDLAATGVLGLGAQGLSPATGRSSLTGGGYGLPGAGGLAAGPDHLATLGGAPAGLVAGPGSGLLPAGTSGGPLQMYSYQPPSEDLVQALCLLAKYVFVVEPPAPDAPPSPAQAGPVAWLPPSPVATLPLPSGRLALSHHASPLLASPSFSPGVQGVSRKLYRLLRRTFAQWQPSSSASLTKLIGLWAAVLAPWKGVTYSDTAALAAALDSLQAAAAANRGGRHGGGGLGGAGGGLGGGGGLRRSGLGSGSAGGAAGGSLFGGAMGQQLAASTAATLNRWGSEVAQVAHQLSAAAHHGGGSELGFGEPRGGSGGQSSARYTRAWRAHVWAHLPFYSLLLPAFLELAYSQMAYSTRAALNNVYRVLKIFTESGEELLQELRAAEEAFNRYAASNLRRPEGEMADLLPWLADQVADWEAAAAAGAPTQPPLVPDTRYRMFSLDHGGAASCMRALLAAADRQNISHRDKLRAAAERVLPLAELPSEELAVTDAHVAGRDLPKAGDWRELRYHGDWMLRPIASNEVPPLVRLLVRISCAVNGALRLTGTATPPGDEPPETVLQELLGAARRRGWRLNLRPLAEVQTLVWLVGLVLFGRLLVALINSPGGLFSLDEEHWAELAADAPAGHAAGGAPGWQHHHAPPHGAAQHQPHQPHW